MACMLARRLRIQTRRSASTFYRLFATAVSHEDDYRGEQNRLDGAWTLLAALDKAKEADNVKVAQLVSSLGYLWPQHAMDNPENSQQHTLRTSSHSSDPAFFSIPADAIEWTKRDVLDLLRASLRGRRIDLPTIETVLRAATAHFRAVPGVVTIPPLQSDQRVTVVGDLHGSLTDLNTVLGLIGDPSAQNRAIFNGDLADRGDHGIEVIAVVCALTLAFPDYVHVNRGNHEDIALSVAYGLATEVQHKYGTTAFRRLRPLLDAFFRSLPLATVVENDALIVHAGPPPPGWTIARVKQKLQQKELLASRTSRTGGQRGTDIDILVESCLWSDPDVNEQDGSLIHYDNDEDHLKPNLSRGAGFKFDGTIVKALLESEGLVRLIRSHEPVHKGCARYTVCDQCNMELFTVFSASRYPYKQGFNDGAILRLQANRKHTVQRYATEEDDAIVDYGMARDKTKCGPVHGTVDSVTIRKALRNAIRTRRPELERAFEEAGEDIPFEQAMQVLIQGLNLEGEGLSQPGPMLALAKALTEDDELPETLDILGVLDAWYDQEDDDTTTRPIASGWLKAIFATVDTNDDHEIDKNEWRAAVESINSNLPPDAQKIDAESTWKLLDQTGNGRISAAEWSTLARITCR